MRRHLVLWAVSFAAGSGLAGCAAEPGPASGSRVQGDRGRLLSASIPTSPEAQATILRANALFRFAGPRQASRFDRAKRADRRPALPAGEREGLAMIAGRIHAKRAAKTEWTAEASVGARASDAIAIRERGTAHTTNIALQGARAVEGKVADGYVVYENAYLGTADILARPGHDGVEDFVLFRERPARTSLRYSVALGGSIAGLRLVGRSLEMLDAQGTPKVRMSAPWAVDANGKYTALSTSVVDCAVDTSPKVPWGRPVVAPGRSTCTIEVSWTEAAAYPLLVDPTWTTAASPSSSHYAAVAEKLTDGRVLVAGGYDATDLPTAVSEIFDPATGTWSTTGSMSTTRAYHAGARLASGSVLVSGGETATYPSLATAEIYDPQSGEWSATGSLANARETHTMHLLPNGRVVAFAGAAYNPSWVVYNDVEIFDPASGTWSAGAAMTTARYFHTSTVLTSGRILVAGGWGATNPVGSSEIYDPSANTWSGTASMMAARELHTATRLADGRVFVAGGDNNTTGVLSSTEYFDPTTGAWSAGPSMAHVRSYHLATALSGGRVLVLGGLASDWSTCVAEAEVFDTSGGSWSSAGTMSQARQGHFGVTLDDSRFLVGGGATSGWSSYASSSELSLPGDAVTDKSSYNAGEPIQVSFLSMPSQGANWIAIAPESSAIGTYLSWSYVSAPNGSASFPGLGPGTYRVRMFFDNGYTLIGQSGATFTVAGAPPSVTPGSTSYTISDPVGVSWASLSGSATDWISISYAGSAPSSYLRWTYTNGAINGNTTFAALPQGTYVARAYNANGLTPVAESSTFTVSGPLPPSVSTDKSSYTTSESVIISFAGLSGSTLDWVSVALEGSGPSQYFGWTYTGGGTSGSSSISLSGAPPGTYVARAFNNNSYTIEAESATFTVAP